MISIAPHILRWWRIDAAGVAACALVTVACYYALVQPAIQSRENRDALLPRITERTRALQAAKAELSNLQLDLGRVTTELAGLPLKLEPSSQVNSRLAGLADLASDLGLDLHKMLPDPPRSGERYGVVPIVLSGRGEYSQVTRFMRDVNERFEDVAVVRFDLQSQGRPGQPEKFDITLAWYTLPAMGFVDNAN